MKNYFEKLQKKLDRYKDKYHKRPRRAALKLAWWNFKCIFKRHKIQKNIENQSVSRKTKIDPNKLSVAFILSGGIGDFLINLNYIAYFKEYVNSNLMDLQIFRDNKINFLPLLPKDENYVLHNENIKWWDIQDDFDVVITLSRFPQFRKCNLEKVKLYAPKLEYLYVQYNDFYQKSSKILDVPPSYDYAANQIALANGQCRIQQPDIYNILKIKEEYKSVPNIGLGQGDVLKSFGITKKFITVNRGIEQALSCKETIKLWDVECYEKLIFLIKKHFPEYQIVQMGTSYDKCILFQNIDIDLIGKTTLEEVKVLLKNATLHIDGDGGMVHLRKAISGGVSAVLFGPTDINFYGYSNNINIKAENACKICSCEWIRDNWRTSCLKDVDKNSCFKKLAPEYVFEKIKGVL